MAGDDDIDFGWADQPIPKGPEVPAADQLAAAIVDYDVSKFAVPSPFECKDALKHLGCRWNPDRKVWVARNAVMAAAAQEIVNKHTGRNQKRPQQRCGTFAQKVQAQKVQQTAGQAIAGIAAEDLKPGDVVYADTDGKVAVVRGKKREQFDPPAISAAENLSDELLTSELRKRGYTVAKLGVYQTLAEVLADQDDEDPFSNLEDL